MNCRVLESKKCTITSNYGNRTINGKKDFHQGVDIVKEGYQLDYITAHSNGKIVSCVDGKSNAKGSGSYGNLVKIEHGNGYCTLYGHMKKGLLVKNGQTVKAGQRLGYMGDSGDAYGAHLHFEVWEGNNKINPTEYLNKNLPSNINTENIEIKYEIGDIVEINGVYISSTSKEKLRPLITRGKITRIIENTDNPYLLNNGKIGWVNNESIISKINNRYLSNKTYKGTSLVDALKEINIDSSFKYREQLAKINNINNYQGTANQNTNMLNLLKQGLLKY